MSSKKPSRLLIDEQPLVLIKSLATVLGINHALILQQLHFLIGVAETAKNEYVHIDDRWWVYNSYAEWKRTHFPWLADSTVKRIFLELGKRGLVLTKNSVKNPSDRRNWYTIDYDAFAAFQDDPMGSKRDGGWDQIDPMVGSKRDDGYSETTSETTSKTKESPAEPVVEPEPEAKTLTPHQIMFGAIRDAMGWTVTGDGQQKAIGKVATALLKMMDNDGNPAPATSEQVAAFAIWAVDQWWSLDAPHRITTYWPEFIKDWKPRSEYVAVIPSAAERKAQAGEDTSPKIDPAEYFASRDLLHTVIQMPYDLLEEPLDDNSTEGSAEPTETEDSTA